MSLSSISELGPLQEADGMEELPTLQSPLISQTKKRQRRLTLTAMTGALGDITTPNLTPTSTEFGWGAAPRMSSHSNASVASATPSLERGNGAATVAAGCFRHSRSPLVRRDSSPSRGPLLLPGFKRTRDSIGPDLSPEVMMRRAAQKFSKPPPQKLSASSSSNSDEDGDDDTMARRRQQAFELGLKAAEGPGAGESWATTVGVGVSLSPRSFARGCKAAEIAAKVEEEMKMTRSFEVDPAEDPKSFKNKPVPDSPVVSPAKRPNPLLRKKAAGGS